MRHFCIFILLLVGSITLSAQKGTIRGTILDGGSGETVIGANVLVVETGLGTTTDLDGAFSLELDPGTYNLRISYIGYQNISIEEVDVQAGEVYVIPTLQLLEDNVALEEVVVKASAIRSSEVAILLMKQNSTAMLDGISSSLMQLTGDATAVEAAKRVTGVSIEGGKYVYVRGLGDRYTKTTLNGVDIPGLDPDRNSLQMDIFPSNLIDNIIVSKNFTAEMPADFTGGLLNVETKSFPEEKTFTFSLGTSFNPNMHFNDQYLAYDGGKLDWLGVDDGARSLPANARSQAIPTPISGASPTEVNDFVTSFNPELAAERTTSLLNYSAGLSYGNQYNVGENKLGLIFSLSYKSDYKYYDDVTYGEFQRFIDPNRYEMRYATIQNGQIGEREVLMGALAGLAFKTQKSKIRLTGTHLQSGISRAAKFAIDNDGEAVGQSGYFASSDNLEYNQRSLTNVLLHGKHLLAEEKWEIDWRLSPTLSVSDDPDIRKTAFTETNVDTSFIAGAGGNPARIWRYLDEVSAIGKIDLTRKYTFRGEDAKLKFGASHTYKQRDYEILFFDVQFFGSQDWPNPDPATVLNPDNIFPNRPNAVYYQSGNNTPNPNAYNSNSNNTGVYISNEFVLMDRLKSILGVRAENFVQRHTGRDQAYANGDFESGRNLDNEKVLESLDWFPSANFIYALAERQNLRASYSRSIARPSFKELSFAQILDPITNRIFNGGFFSYSDWDGNLTETRINNFDLRWELFQENGQLFSVSAFYKQFDDPIELVRIPEQQTSTEYQPRNVGDGSLIGVELEFRKDLGALSSAFSGFGFSGNLTLVRSEIDMTATEFNSRLTYEKNGQTIEDTRQMAGQAPYVINTGLTYNSQNERVQAGLFYNVKGETLEIVGAGLFPDIYFQPFHSLNFSLNAKLGSEKNTSLDFQVANLLNDRVESLYQSFQAEGQIFNSINPGISFGIGLNHRF